MLDLFDPVLNQYMELDNSNLPEDILQRLYNQCSALLSQHKPLVQRIAELSKSLENISSVDDE